jgi:hypothetical protein
VKTQALPRAIVGNVQNDQANDAPQHERFVRHPVRATVHEAEHLREIAAKGDSPATPVILAGLVLAFIVPLAAILIVLDFTVAHFS